MGFSSTLCPTLYAPIKRQDPSFRRMFCTGSFAFNFVRFYDLSGWASGFNFVLFFFCLRVPYTRDKFHFSFMAFFAFVFSEREVGRREVKNLTAGNFRTFRHFLVCFYQFSFILHAGIVVFVAAFWLGFMRFAGEARWGQVEVGEGKEAGEAMEDWWGRNHSSNNTQRRIFKNPQHKTSVTLHPPWGLPEQTRSAAPHAPLAPVCSSLSTLRALNTKWVFCWSGCRRPPPHWQPLSLGPLHPGRFILERVWKPAAWNCHLLHTLLACSTWPQSWHRCRRLPVPTSQRPKRPISQKTEKKQKKLDKKLNNFN